jgi:hypothetical protein
MKPIKMTAEQEKTYATLRDAGWEYAYTDTEGWVFVERHERGAEYSRLLERRMIASDGSHGDHPIT